jgi:hypothetical protein
MGSDDPTGSDADDLAREQAEAEAEKNDPRRLLPGEDPGSPFREDAQHWVEVYRELVETKAGILAKLREDRRGLDVAGQAELNRDDRVLQLELERLQARLAAWEQRLRQAE